MSQQKTEGKDWKAIKNGETYIVSINDKAELTGALQDFVEKSNIRTGEVRGIGALNYVKLKFFDPKTKNYDEKEFNEQFELVSAIGNISIVEGKPLIHLHGTMGREDYSALAGHIEKALIRGAGEFYITPMPVEVGKKKNEDIGLNIYDF